MPDIFISYSRKDSQQAERLERMLTSAGFSCWIDKVGIDAATTWSGEIVDAIDNCKVFVVMLSPHSIASHNVVKEVSLAAEQRKKILPLDVEEVELPRDLKYHLAGIQRAPIANFDVIIRALEKLGLEANTAPPMVTQPILSTNDGSAGGTAGGARAAARSARKSLMILPFEDLSPTGDNQWFADGIVSELISALTNVKALKVADSQATKEFKKYHGQLATYAQEMQIRYFVQGDVRKFGEQIKISSRLLDIEFGDYLWQDAMKGTMNDIFEIQEQVAEKVVEGLKVHLASDEKKKLSERGTENAEAYELFLKAREYFERLTRNGFDLAIGLYTEAIALDPNYAQAYSEKANALANIYRGYDRDPKLLDESLTLIKEALRLKPNLWAANNALSTILMFQGNSEEAEQAARHYIQNAPEDAASHFSLGFFYNNIGQPQKAIPPYAAAVALKPDYLTALGNLVNACHSAKDFPKQKSYAELAIPKFEKYVKLFPEDEARRVTHAVLLYYAGRDEEAKKAARKLEHLRDGTSLYNTACLLCMLKEYDEGIRAFEKSIEAGFRYLSHLKSFLEDEEEGVAPLKGTPKWEEMKQLVEKLSEPFK